MTEFWDSSEIMESSLNRENKAFILPSGKNNRVLRIKKIEDILEKNQIQID